MRIEGELRDSIQQIKIINKARSKIDKQTIYEASFTAKLLYFKNSTIIDSADYHGKAMFVRKNNAWHLTDIDSN